jgi:hypothetical protein
MPSTAPLHSGSKAFVLDPLLFSPFLLSPKNFNHTNIDAYGDNTQIYIFVSDISPKLISYFNCCLNISTRICHHYLTLNIYITSLRILIKPMTSFHGNKAKVSLALVT